MHRRNFLAIFGSSVLATAGAAIGQSARKVYRLGLFSAGPPLADTSPFAAPLIRSLQQRGYIVGQNLALERRGAEGQTERLPGLLGELIASKVDVIFAINHRVALAAKNGTTLPVVVFSAGDPVATGLVESLARPGGHMTGIADLAAELAPKRLQLLKEVAPNLRRVAMLWNAGDPGMTGRYEVSEAAARLLGLSVEPLAVKSAEDFEPAFSAMKKHMPDAIFVVDDRLTATNRKVIFDFAAAHRLPAMYELDFLVRYGGLMSYGPDLDESLDRAAALIDRIFNGARPQDLPFEQPTRYRLVINLKTARLLGLELPASLLSQADEVIE